ncbi:RNA chaperone Hfq [Balnearium lithotrophicum]|uniref:RNA chaperone Hfq n=1 Tax=Balnearium lithotrophicum TaxID=223788 RepID=A0A521BVH7_9BACT|nr:RNA chaperone Hfq [Balnearium lithotrophicum]SMO51178.1 RNA chaperone Hfq [Balnearium lithotrophicum]
MPSQSKSEKVKIWIKEYLSEFGEYNGTIEELSNLTNASPYIVKKVLKELEKEGFLKSESKRGKGLTIKLAESSEPQKEEEVAKVEEKEEKQKNVEEVEVKEKKEKEKKKSLQDRVLSSLLGKDVTVFLISGTRLEGKLLDFDNFTLSMTAPKGKSLVYKHAIATILYDVEE